MDMDNGDITPRPWIRWLLCGIHSAVKHLLLAPPGRGQAKSISSVPKWEGKNAAVCAKTMFLTALTGHHLPRWLWIWLWSITSVATPISSPPWDQRNWGLEVKEDTGSGKEIPASIFIYAQTDAAGPTMECWKGPQRSMRVYMEDLLVLYWEGRGFQKLSPFIPLPRFHPGAPCHMWWGSYRCLQNFTSALGREAWSVTDSDKYLLYQRVLSISSDCTNVSDPTTPKEILDTQIPNTATVATRRLQGWSHRASLDSLYN